MGLLLNEVIDVSAICVVGTSRVKITCVSSVEYCNTTVVVIFFLFLVLHLAIQVCMCCYVLSGLEAEQEKTRSRDGSLTRQ